MRGFRRPNPQAIVREISYFTRAFPAQYVEIYREAPKYGLKGQYIPGSGTRQTIFAGTATVVPAGGVVELFGGGQVERTTPTLIIAGDYPIAQGDFVQLDGRTYQVENPLNHHGQFVEVRFQQHRQAVT